MRSGAARQMRGAIYGSDVSQALRHGGLLPEAELALIQEATQIEPADFQFVISPAAQLAAIGKLNLNQLSWLRSLLDPASTLDLKRHYFLKSYLLSSARSFPLIESLLDLGPVFSQNAVDEIIHDGDAAVASIHCLTSNIALPTGIHTESLEATGYLQAAALRKLIALRVRHVFSSNIGEILTAHDGIKKKLLRNLLFKRHGKIASTDLWLLFPQWEIPDHLTDQQLRVLALFGAEITYALMYPGVSLYPLATKHRLRPPIGYDQFPDSAPSTPALGEVLSKFLNTNPGASVAVCADFPQLLARGDIKLQHGEPFIELTQWPQLVTSLWWRLPEAAAVAVEECFDGCKQGFMISQLAQLPIRVFPKIQSATAALQALQKLVLDNSLAEKADAEMVRDFLLSISVSGDVHVEILENYESRRGVFSQLHYRSGFKFWLQKIFGRS